MQVKLRENVYFCNRIVNNCMQNRIFITFLSLFLLALLSSCWERREQKVVTPWGEVSDSIPVSEEFDLQEIQHSGELIMLTMSGPQSCYEYKGKKLGLEYLLCSDFADKQGVGLRVEICRDTLEMMRRLEAGEADVIAYQLPYRLLGKRDSSLVFCGVRSDSLQTGWLASGSKTELIEALNAWFRPSLVAEMQSRERFLLSSGRVRRRVFAPMLNRKQGVISRYDPLFIAYGREIRWDWRLLAAQCYQESTFDPQAQSWAGACGLMQIMPETAKLLDLPLSKIYEPESNIAAATRYLSQLEAKFSDIPLRSERLKFVLACYNGGYHHIRDAMALASRDGHPCDRWSMVAPYVLRLSEPRYYNDPVVKYGYMRGSEAVDYVDRIHQRWQSYRGVKTAVRPESGGLTPQPATKRNRFSHDR